MAVDGISEERKMSVERARKTGHLRKRNFSKGLPSPVIDQQLTSKQNWNKHSSSIPPPAAAKYL